MTDMREKVARAICEQNLISTRQPTDAETMNSYWPSFKREADAALIACGYAEMRKALEELHTASARVSRLGATVGPQWSYLTAAVLSARSILERTGE